MMARRVRAIGHRYDSDENMTMMTTTRMLMLPMMMMILMLITILMAVNRTGGHDYGGGAVDDGNDGRCNDDNPDDYHDSGETNPEPQTPKTNSPKIL